ncbi:MAG: hypothetical protein AAF447_22830 [Myxococcota bacterium]
MLVVGVDENGMGPRLGPLVATAVSLELRRYEPGRLRRRGNALRVGDSKRFGAFGRMAELEGLTLALAERELGRPVRDADALLDALSLDGAAGRRAPCPGGTSTAQCWTPLALPAFGGDAEEGRARLARLEGRALRVRRVRTTWACAGTLNAAMAEGIGKLDVDLRLFERLLLDARAALGGPLDARCGMIGGLRHYVPRFHRLQEAVVLREGRGVSRYRVPALGTVSFEVKADDRHLPVGLASMVGKVVRELAMRRIVSHYQALDGSLRTASGYHDPVTRAFVDATATHRRRLRIAEGCFERRG